MNPIINSKVLQRNDIKDINELLKEISILNKYQSYDINQILSFIRSIEFILGDYEKLNDCSIKTEFYRLKNDLTSNNNRIKLLCLMIQANYYIFGYYPRYTQLISLYFFFNKKENSGLIQEIKTGEGKSLIIAFLAVFNNLVYNKKVDILTSSIVLAERDCNLYRRFYDLFDIKTDFCREELDNNKTFKKCYATDILYGDCLSFESDILRTTFCCSPGRKSDRGFDCIIIDEIDNICIDNIRNITELLDDFPGYKVIEYIYLFIYNQLIKIVEAYNDDKLMIILNKEKIIEKLIIKLEDFLDDNKRKDFEKIYYPTFLHDYINLRKKEWCKSAFDAKYEYELNKHYKISENEFGFKTIKPIDYHNTGVIQQNSVWPGLHQFLEIKEGLKLTEENLNSCYMSNLTFFKKYKNTLTNNIYGLTGTLDSEKTQLVLRKIYNLEFVIIPTFRKCLLEVKKPSFTSDRKEYLNKIVNSIEYYSKKRAVLVIFEFIENIHEINKKLRLMDSIDENKIIIYKDSENKKESFFLNNEITEGTIILSTNLAARGTDIKISKNLEKNGGLHVILTFFPINERVENQAFGRAGRKGEKGSAEMIIFSFDNYENKILERKEKENKLYDELINNFSVRDELYETLFNEFCNLLQEIRKKNIKGEKELILDLKEKWGFFLIKNNINNLNGQKDRNKETIFKNFNKLKQEIKNSLLNSNNKYIYRNPLIESNSINLENLQRIVKECEIYSIGANYHIVYLLSKNGAKKNEIIKYLDKLKNRLKEFIKFFDNYLMQNVLEIKQSEKKMSQDLEEQLKEKKEIFNYILENINQNSESLGNWLNSSFDIDSTQREYIYDLKRPNGKPFSKDIVNYLYDLGIYFLYQIKGSFSFLRIFS